MKLKIAIAFALIAGLSPALASARTQTPSVHQHGSTMHDRSPHMRTHDSQPHTKVGARLYRAPESHSRARQDS